MTCQSCQRNVPTARVSLAQNIGMLVARQSKNFTADLCRDCGMRMFQSMTLITFFFGWWGVISFIVTPIFLIINLVAWSNLRKLPQSDAWVGAGSTDPGTFGAPPPPSGTLDAGLFAAGPVSQAGPYSGTFGQGPTERRFPGVKSAADSAANWALGLAVASIMFFCIPFVAAGGLFMAWKAKNVSQQEGREVPKTVWVAAGLSALSLLMFAGTLAIGVFAEHEKAAKVQALRASTDKSRLLASLDKDTACGLVEEQLLEGLYDHKQGHKKLTCSGALLPMGDTAQLENVIVEWEGETKTFTACLRKDTRWFVASLSPCVQAPLPAKTAGLDAEAQEDAWRESERKALAAERLALFDKNIAAIHQGTAFDLETCSSKTAKALFGSALPDSVVADLPTVDDELLAGKRPKGWEFLNSDSIVKALRGKADERADAMKELFQKRYLVVAKSEISRELPVVPSSKAGMAYDGGAFLGMMYVADVTTGKVACIAPLAVENSDSVSVMEYRGSKASDETVRTEVLADFRKQYSAAIVRTLGNAFSDKPLGLGGLAGDEDADEPEDPADAPPAKPAVPVVPAKAGAKKMH